MGKNLIGLYEFMQNELVSDDTELNEYLNEEFTEGYFSSEFFKAEKLNENSQYANELYDEFRRIKPLLKNGMDSSAVTRRFFELQKRYMNEELNKDTEYVSLVTERVANELETLIEETDNLELKESRKTKVKRVKDYRKCTLENIETERLYMEKFYANNPKILVTY